MIKGAKMGEKKKIGLGRYPYINTRVRTMKAGLIPKSDYMKLSKMSLPNMARYLQEGCYKKEINEFAQKYDGLDLIENAIEANLAATFSKLIRISSNEVSMLIEVYLGRWDLRNIKALMRAKHSKIPLEDTKRALIPCGNISGSLVEELFKTNTVEDLLELAKKKNYIIGADEAIKAYNAKGLCNAENVLDKAYYSDLLSHAENMPKQGKIIRAFIETEIDIRNLKLIFRLKREGFKKEDILKHILYPGAHLGKTELSMLAATPSVDELCIAIKKTHYGRILEESIKKYKDAGSMSPIQTALDKCWLAKADRMLHQHPLSINPILGFMLSKEIEYKNIRLIAHVHAFNLPEDVITENLIA